MIQERPIQKQFDAWHEQIAEWKEKAPFRYRVTEEVLKSQHMQDHMQRQETRSSCRRWSSRCCTS